MAEIAVGGAINEGFSLIRRHPGAVLVWGVTQVVIAAATVALYAPVYFAFVAAARSGAGASAIQAINPQIMRMQSLTYLLDIVQLIVASVVWCAVFRAVLRPESGQFAFLRLSVVEFYVVVLLIGAYFAFGVGLILPIIVFTIVIVALVAMHQILAAVIIGVVAAIALMVALVYVLLRFSMVGPMIVDDGQFHLGESWNLTRGHVGSLFMIGFLLVILAAIAEIVLGIVLVALGAGGLIAIAGGPQNLAALFQEPPQALLARLGPLFIVAALIWIPFVGCFVAIMAAPWARAYRDLKPPDVSATFA